MVYFILLVVICILAPAPVQAVDGLIEINQASALAGGISVGDTPGFPVTIDASGSYVLTGPLTTTAGSNAYAIEVLGTGSEEVQVDLNGFAIVGDTSGSPAGGVRAVNLKSMAVRNGSMQIPSPGSMVRVEDTSDAVIEDLKGETSTSSGITIVNLGSFVVRGNSLSGGGSIDIQSNGASVVRGVIEDNIVLDAEVWGIYVEANNAPLTIRDNVIERAGSRGIAVSQCTACIIADNTIRESTQQGIYLGVPKGCRVSGNVVTHSGGDGIYFTSSEGCLAAENVSTHNTGSGLVLDSSNLAVGNILNFNGGAGLLLDNVDNVFGRNMARGNGGAGLPTCQAASGGLAPPDWCDLSVGNDSMGDNMMPGPPPS